MNTIELSTTILSCEREAIAQAEKDILFSGCAPLAKMSDDDKRAMCNALKQYAANGATRAVRFLIKEGMIKV